MVGSDLVVSLGNQYDMCFDQTVILLLLLCLLACLID